MKKMLLSLAVVLGSTALFAQTTPAESDTAKINLPNVDIWVISKVDTSSTSAADTIPSIDEPSGPDKDALTHWGGLDLGVNMLLNADGGTDMAAGDEWLELDVARSGSVRLNLFESKIRLAKDYVGLVTGVGFTWNKYAFKNNIVMSSNGDSTFAATDSLINYRKNSLRATYVQVPLMVEFNTSEDPERTFHLAAGVIGGWKIGSRYKQYYDYEGKEYKSYVKDDYNLNPLTLDATARIGYRNLTLWATYGLTSLFEKDKGPEVYPVSVGLTVIPF